MAATNRPEILDKALLRAGRFDRQIVVDKPDVAAREAILRLHTAKMTLAPNVDLTVVAQRTPGFVGADLANIPRGVAALGYTLQLPVTEKLQEKDVIDGEQARGILEAEGRES